jgi:hypothetical protein
MPRINHRVASRKFDNNFRRGELKRLFLHRGVPEIAVYNMVEDILAERIRWTKQPLGRRVNLIFIERHRLGIRTIACIDKTEAWVRRFYRDCKRERDRRRVTKMRARITNQMRISRRAKELAAVLNEKWTESRVLGDLMQKRWKLKPIAMQKAMHRTSHELCDANVAELKYGAGSRRGGSRVLFLRLKPAIVDLSTYRQARNTDEIRVP